MARNGGPMDHRHVDAAQIGLAKAAMRLAMYIPLPGQIYRRYAPEIRILSRQLATGTPWSSLKVAVEGSERSVP